MAQEIPEIGWSELLPGAHVNFDVAPPKQLPESITAIEVDAVRQRAIDAWESADRLMAVWALWHRFLWCGETQTMPDSATRDRIASHFPKLAVIAPILEALAPTNTLRGEKKQQRDLADERAEITRGGIERMTRQEKQLHRGRNIQELVSNFQKEVRVHCRVLSLCGIQLPEFQRSCDELLDHAAIPMAITQDSTGDRPPINFGTETRRLADERFTRLHRAVHALLELLEYRPLAVLVPAADVSENGDSDAEPERQDDDGDTVEPEAEPEKSAYLGIRLDEQNQSVTRDGWDNTYHLPPIPFRLLRLLFKAAGSLVGGDSLRTAWPADQATADDVNVRTEISRLRKATERLGLVVKNKRGEGYKLVEA